MLDNLVVAKMNWLTVVVLRSVICFINSAIVKKKRIKVGNSASIISTIPHGINYLLLNNYIRF